MFRVLVSLAASAAFAAIPAAAQAPADPPAGASEDLYEIQFEQQIRTYYQHLIDKRFKEARQVAATIRATTPNREVGAGLATLMEAPIAAARNKDADARKLLASGEAATADVPDLLMWIVPAFLVVDRKDMAGFTVDRLIARAPDTVRAMNPELVMDTLRESGEPRKVIEDRWIALAELGFLGNEGDQVSGDAVGILMMRGDTARAVGLLRFIDDPRVIENLLVQRRFSALWPALTAQAGPKLANSRESSVRLALQDHAEQPDNPETLSALISAYRSAQRPLEAIALLPKLPQTPAALAEADEQTGWAVNNLALALHEAKRADEADRLFANLNEALPANGWRVNMFINRAELRVTDGKFAEALPLIELAEKEPKSAYAEQLLRRMRYCTLVRLGRASDAAALLPEVLKHAVAARAPTIDGLICAGNVDQAEKLALQYADDTNFHEDFVRSLQTAPLSDSDPSVWGGWSALRSRPAIAAAFDRLGRDLPEELRAGSR